jgi:hypothetical protein
MFTSVKRVFQVLVCIVLLGGISLTGLYNYIDTNEEVQARLKLSVEDAEMRVDRDAGFWEKAGALISSWWDSDELVAEAQQDKDLRDHSKKQQEERERERRFNDSQYSENDDYYGSSR